MWEKQAFPLKYVYMYVSIYVCVYVSMQFSVIFVIAKSCAVKCCLLLLSPLRTFAIVAVVVLLLLFLLLPLLGRCAVQWPWIWNNNHLRFVIFLRCFVAIVGTYFVGLAVAVAFSFCFFCYDGWGTKQMAAGMQLMHSIWNIHMITVSSMQNF